MRSGFVCIIGRPNAGKSTLLNALVGEKLAIVTHKPQTTRTRIQGIINLPKKKSRPAAQVVLVDTPGVHRSETSLDKKMMQEIRDALHGCDLILLMVDATEKIREDKFVFDLIKHADTPVFLVVNKIDKVEKGALLPLIEQYSKMFQFKEIIPISALKKDGLDELLLLTIKALPEGPAYFPKDEFTDQPARFLAAETIREQVLLETEQEVPYAATVVIEQFEETPKLTRIAAVIYVERDGQKAIVIGKGGQMLKKIGSAARVQIERMLGTKVFLELFVKVHANWRESREFIEEIDWRRQMEQLMSGASEPGES
ncbi:MAG TPA: GTPase Era [Terriglobales bacterium]|nr:GTPase Era [Terriglobales bacterium]